MNRVVEILMRRDNLSPEEALNQIQTVRQMMENCGYNPEECEDIMRDEIGLEMDYIDDVLFGD